VTDRDVEQIAELPMQPWQSLRQTHAVKGAPMKNARLKYTVAQIAALSDIGDRNSSLLH